MTEPKPYFIIDEVSREEREALPEEIATQMMKGCKHRGFKSSSLASFYEHYKLKPGTVYYKELRHFPTGAIKHLIMNICPVCECPLFP